jgi:hypothetical protein
MSKQKLLVLTAVVALSVLGAASQSQAQTVVRCQIPFGFTLGGEQLPAGSYTVNADSGSPKMLVLQNQAGNVSRIFMVLPGTNAPAPEARLTFNRYGNHYFLVSLALDGGATTLNLRHDKSEREFMLKSAPTVTTVALNQ